MQDKIRPIYPTFTPQEWYCNIKKVLSMNFEGWKIANWRAILLLINERVKEKNGMEIASPEQLKDWKRQYNNSFIQKVKKYKPTYIKLFLNIARNVLIATFSNTFHPKSHLDCGSFDPSCWKQDDGWRAGCLTGAVLVVVAVWPRESYGAPIWGSTQDYLWHVQPSTPSQTVQFNFPINKK